MLLHSCLSDTVEGMLSDYAFVICGILDLFVVSGDSSLCGWAQMLQKRADILFRVGSGGDTVEYGDVFSIATGEKHVIDSWPDARHEPLAVAINALNINRLSILFHDAGWNGPAAAKGLMNQYKRQLRNLTPHAALQVGIPFFPLIDPSPFFH